MTEEELKTIDDAIDLIQEAAYREYRNSITGHSFANWWKDMESHKVYAGLVTMTGKYSV